MTVFSASKNCFSGLFPVTNCANSKNINELYLDGLSSSDR
jgi:hypothetical protein